MTPVMRGAIRCGQNSLPIFCLGVLLAFASHVALLDVSRACDADRAESRGYRGDDRDRNAAELDQHQTQAAITMRSREVVMLMAFEAKRGSRAGTRGR